VEGPPTPAVISPPADGASGEASGIISRVDRLLPTDAFREWSATAAGQLTGLVLLTLPAVTNPLPLNAVAHAIVQIIAVAAGFVGAVAVFGGLVTRVFLMPGDRSLDDLLPQIPRGRTAWWALVALVVLLVVGAEWRLVLIFTDDWSTHLPEVLVFLLPAVALGYLAWRTRALRAPRPRTGEEAGTTGRTDARPAPEAGAGPADAGH
jgi:hypothetical protein